MIYKIFITLYAILFAIFAFAKDPILEDIEMKEVSDDQIAFFQGDKVIDVLYKELKVPLDYNKRKSRKNRFSAYYEIVFRDGKKSKKPLIYIAGGPYYDINSLEGLSFYFMNHFYDLLKERDIIIIHDRASGLVIDEVIKCEDWNIPKPFKEKFDISNFNKVDCDRTNDELRTILSHDTDAKTIQAILKKEKIKQADVYGESWGAWRAAHFAKAYPDRVKSLMLVGPMLFSQADFGKNRRAMLQELDDLASNKKYGWSYSLAPSEIHQKYTDYLQENTSEKFRNSLDIALAFSGGDYFQDHGMAYLFGGDESPMQRIDVSDATITARQDTPFGLLLNVKLCPYHMSVQYIPDTEGYNVLNQLYDRFCDLVGFTKQDITSSIDLGDLPVQVLAGRFDLTMPASKEHLMVKSNNMGYISRDTWHSMLNCVKEDKKIIEEFYGSYKITNDDISCDWQFLYGDELSDDNLFPPLRKMELQ